MCTILQLFIEYFLKFIILYIILSKICTEKVKFLTFLALDCTSCLKIPSCSRMIRIKMISIDIICSYIIQIPTIFSGHGKQLLYIFSTYKVVGSPLLKSQDRDYGLFLTVSRIFSGIRICAHSIALYSQGFTLSA